MICEQLRCARCRGQHFSGISSLYEAGSINMPISQGAQLRHRGEGHSSQLLTHRWPSQGRGVHMLNRWVPVCACVPSLDIIIQSMQCGRPGFDPWVGKIPWRREMLPTPVFWPGESHGLYRPWGRKEWDMTERLSLTLPHPPCLTGWSLLSQLSEVSRAALCEKATPWWGAELRDWVPTSLTPGPGSALSGLLWDTLWEPWKISSWGGKCSKQDFSILISWCCARETHPYLQDGL